MASVQLYVPKSVRILQPTAVAEYQQYIGVAVKDLVPGVKKLAQDATPVATGRLRDNIAVGTSTTSISLTWIAGHAAPVQYGSRRHWAPIQPIREWVSVKLGSSDPRLPYKIRNKIAKRGTPAKHFLELARRDIYQYVTPLFRARMALLAKLLSGDFGP